MFQGIFINILNLFKKKFNNLDSIPNPLPLNFMKHHSEEEIHANIEKNAMNYKNLSYHNLAQSSNLKMYQGTTPTNTNTNALLTQKSPIINKEFILNNQSIASPFQEDRKKTRLNIVLNLFH